MINSSSPDHPHLRCRRGRSPKRRERCYSGKLSQPSPRLKNVNKALQNRPHRGGLLLPVSAQRPDSWQKGKGWGCGHGRLCQAVAQSLHTGCSEKRKGAEIPNSTGTTPSPQTQMCFTPTTDSDLTLWRCPASSEVLAEGLMPGQEAEPDTFGSASGPPGPASHPILEHGPGEHRHPRAVGTSSTMENLKPCGRR